MTASGRKAAALFLSLLLLVPALSGCGRKVVFTKGIRNTAVFTVGEETGRDYELRTYLVNLANQYKEVYGSDVLTKKGNEKLTEALRQNALSELSRVKALDQMAVREKITLDETKEAAAAQAAHAYYESLTDKEKSFLKVGEKQLTQMYRDYALAGEVYDSIIGNVDTEVSDDEARTVQIQCITIRTYRIDENGKRVEFTDGEKEEAKKKADAIHKEIFDGMKNNTGVTFDTYISRYNEEGSGTYTIGRGEYDEAFENAAFAAETGKIGDVVETKDGYRIIKGISAYDQTQTDANKKKIAKRRQAEAFEKAFNAFADDLESEVDQQAFEKITIPSDPKIQTKSFFDTYNKYFVSTQAD